VAESDEDGGSMSPAALMIDDADRPLMMMVTVVTWCSIQAPAKDPAAPMTEVSRPLGVRYWCPVLVCSTESLWVDH
jgi:hypothetical protein